MHIDDFDFDLPARLIAQEPAAERDQARLLVVRRADQMLEGHVFRELPSLLDPRDLLVLNDTRVVPARLLGRRSRTGGRWEGLFLRVLADGRWELLCQTRGRLLPGEWIDVADGEFKIELLDRSEDGRWLARPNSALPALELLQKHGSVPLPPYIRKGRAQAGDHERYQTVYARQAGAVAAPTAGLHFTPRVFDDLRQRGITWTFVTLHVGVGTFRPIEVEDIRQHHMHQEWGQLDAGAVAAIEQCRARQGRVIAVGTTAVRVLETVGAQGQLKPWAGETDLFIYPPYQFRVVDALITNFHLPRSSLLLLVSAFAGVDLIRRAYHTAIEQEYRFFSYGDAMLIL